eukprot:360031-Chlamydomonas_euryale.AAC.1
MGGISSSEMQDSWALQPYRPPERGVRGEVGKEGVRRKTVETFSAHIPSTEKKPGICNYQQRPALARALKNPHPKARSKACASPGVRATHISQSPLPHLMHILHDVLSTGLEVRDERRLWAHGIADTGTLAFPEPSLAHLLPPYHNHCKELK